MFKDCLGSKSVSVNLDLKQRRIHRPCHSALQWATRHVYIGNTLIPALEADFGKLYMLFPSSVHTRNVVTCFFIIIRD